MPCQKCSDETGEIAKQQKVTKAAVAQEKTDLKRLLCQNEFTTAKEGYIISNGTIFFHFFFFLFINDISTN